MKNIIIDTDLWADCDDTVAISLGTYLDKNKAINLKGITTVYWPAKEKARLAAKVVYLAGGQTPVYAGHGLSLEGKNNCYYDVGRKLLDETDNYKFSDIHAVDYLLSEKDITIAAIGPLTNIASAILRDKSFPEKVNEIYFMGDPFEKKECWNIKCDKKAFDIVKDSGIKLNLVTRKTSKQVWLDETDLKKLKESETKINGLIYKHAKLWMKERKWDVAYMYDPLTVACASGLGFVEFEKAEGNVYFSKNIDATAFKKYLMEALI